MNSKMNNLLKHLEDVFDAEAEIVFEGVLEGFAYYFSKMDVEGLECLLNDHRLYDGVSKEHYLALIEKAFNKLKSNGIKNLDFFPGTCNGCVKGCSGYSFIDSKTGAYIDLIVTVVDNEITNFMECYYLNNDKHVTNKKERIIIKSTITN